ncbi:FAD-binding oxidoreductase [Cupriavidus sp. 8B]
MNAPQALPPDCSAARFAQALRSFAAVLGDDAVLSAPSGLAAYLDPYSPLPDDDPDAFAPAAVLLPGSVTQVQAVLRLASAAGLPLWPVSIGRNLAYGGPAPRLRGTLVLDLRRMNRILEVNPTLAYALVEPGVSYFDLHAYLHREGIALWVDPPAVGWGSVVGNTLERGIGVTPYGDHAAMQCGMEVVLASGDIVRTGMGALAGGSAWQLHRDGYGPGLDGLFMQSNFGIVTKMGIWLMPAPETVLLCQASFAREADLEAVVETLRPLRLADVLHGPAVIESAVRWAASVSARRDWHDGAGPMPVAALDHMIRALDIGWWNLRFGLYGPPALVQARWRIARKAFGAIDGARLTAWPYSAASVASPPPGGGAVGLLGVPSLAAMRMLSWCGGDGAHLDVSPLCPATGTHAMRQYQLVRERAAAYGFDYYGGFTAAPRCLHHIFAAIFDRADPVQRSQARALAHRLVDELGAAGYGLYRAHLDLMDRVAAQQDFNGHAMQALVQRLKDALDPAGMLAPGKQGIWPAGHPSAPACGTD